MSCYKLRFYFYVNLYLYDDIIMISYYIITLIRISFSIKSHAFIRWLVEVEDEILHGGIAHLWREIKMEQFSIIVV